MAVMTKEILALSIEIGDALLRNGAEVYRVEDTVVHILEAYEVEAVTCMYYQTVFLQAPTNTRTTPAAWCAISHSAVSIWSALPPSTSCPEKSVHTNAP